LKETEAIGDRYKLSLITFGHALDGNLHVMVGVDSKQSGSDSPFRRSLQEIYSFALENGGVISGEHGIGLLQREFLGIQFPGNQLSLMKRIKELLDPNGILNPGKSFA
jgi:glycolate oxidase